MSDSPFRATRNPRQGRIAGHRHCPSGFADLERCAVIGVLNVTPDSFSDGGQFSSLDAAIAQGLRLRAEGADVVDVGGESTRPGAQRVSASDELSRVLPVVSALSSAGVPVSIDTTRAHVALAAFQAGASMINDVSGGRLDPDMVKVVAESEQPWIIMHWRGPSEVMRQLANYTDVVTEVIDELSVQIDYALAAGVNEDQIIIDPGLGFAKTSEHNWTLLNQLDRLIDTGFPVLIGASRKSFLGGLLTDGSGNQRSPIDRDDATVAVTTLCAIAGAWGVRVHAVRPNSDAVRVVAALQSSQE